MGSLIDTVPRRFGIRRLLLEPVLLSTNAAFFSWFWLARQTAELHVTLPAQSNERLLLYCWHKHAWVVFAALSKLGLPEAAWIGHDGFLSTMVQRSGLWSGACVLRFALRSPVRPTAQIIETMRNSSLHLAVATDSGGPYGKVKPGLITIANALGARLMPIAVHTTGVPHLGATMRHEVPWPFMRVSIEAGAPLPKYSTRAQAQTALDQLEARLAAVVPSGRHAEPAAPAH